MTGIEFLTVGKLSLSMVASLRQIIQNARGKNDNLSRIIMDLRGVALNKAIEAQTALDKIITTFEEVDFDLNIEARHIPREMSRFGFFERIKINDAQSKMWAIHSQLKSFCSDIEAIFICNHSSSETLIEPATNAYEISDNMDRMRLNGATIFQILEYMQEVLRDIQADLRVE